MQRNRKVWLIHRKKRIIIPEEAKTLELLVIDINSTALHMHNELKENMDKKTKRNQEDNFEQNENINKEIEIIKRN